MKQESSSIESDEYIMVWLLVYIMKHPLTGTQFYIQEKQPDNVV